MYRYSENVSSVAEALFDKINSTCGEVQEYGRLYTSINASIYQVMGDNQARFIPAFTASNAPSIDLARCEFFYRLSPLEARAYLRTLTGESYVLDINVALTGNIVGLIVATMYLTSLYIFTLAIYMGGYTRSLEIPKNHRVVQMGPLLAILLAYSALLYIFIYVEYMIRRGSVGGSLIYFELFSYTLLIGVSSANLGITYDRNNTESNSTSRTEETVRDSPFDGTTSTMLKVLIHPLGLMGAFISLYILTIILLSGGEFLRGLMLRYLYNQGSLEIFATLMLVIPLMVLNLLGDPRLRVAYFTTMLVILASINFVFTDSFLVNSPHFFTVLPAILKYPGKATLIILLVVNTYLFAIVFKNAAQIDKILWKVEVS